MTVVIAGGAGFVGSHLCDRLISEGQHVICVDNLITGRKENIQHLLEHDRFSFLLHDIVEHLALTNVSEIYHLASPASPPAYQRHQVETLTTNSQGTRQLLELALENGAKFLFASTSEVYGDPLEHPQCEKYWGNVNSVGPRSMYDEAKRYGESLTKAYERTYGVDTRIIRIFNTYGPRMDPDDGRVVSNFIVSALRRQPFTVYGDGTQTRSFQYIDDLVEGIVRVMASSYKDPVNLGNPVEFTMIQLAELIRKLTHTSSQTEYSPLPEDDPRRRKPNIDLAKSLLDWEPQVPLQVGLARTVSYFQHELRLDFHQPEIDLSGVDIGPWQDTQSAVAG